VRSYQARAGLPVETAMPLFMLSHLRGDAFQCLTSVIAVKSVKHDQMAHASLLTALALINFAIVINESDMKLYDWK
jgi:hypothetical protein